jgi:formylglycine-generating enzyme required for sulfatase activity
VKYGDDIRFLRRQLESDPQNPDLLLRYHHSVARVYGESTLSLLYSRKKWNKADQVLQDAAIGAVSRRLGVDYELTGVDNYQCNKQTHRLASFVHRQSQVTFSLLPGGGFSMGSSDLEAELSYCERFIYDLVPEEYEDESPARWITLKPFLLSRTMLLQGQWQKVTRGSNRDWRDAQLPCFGMSWVDCQRWLEMVGAGFRFPFEDEWEYGCRAGSGSRFFWGDDMKEEYCWYSENSDSQPHSPEEHQHQSNAFGLVDMLGNVSEWCQDWDGKDEMFRVYRGGNYLESPALCRAAWREGKPPNDLDSSVGLRVAASIPGF